ncbi:hypothetical protein R5R35_010934 [Gryllus longicercus]|uniref:Uncharacterized protein n=1 Tax=Gryllus longicercus TaxID=2509291 RepID=A0AAN9VWP1_9ORTH
MSDSERSVEEGPKSYHQEAFVSILKDHRILFEKSQLPSSRRKKAEALTEAAEKYRLRFGKEITSRQLSKKISNLKDRVKKKTDVLQTGNRKIKLKEWEKDYLKLINGGTNPTVTRIEGAIEAGVASVSDDGGADFTSSLQENGASISASVIFEDGSSMYEEVTPVKRKRNVNRLSNAELQRLVYVEQLEVLQLKKRKLQWQLDQMMDFQQLEVLLLKKRKLQWQLDQIN